MFRLDMVDAIQVQFLKPLFEDDFPEKGMKAWLTDIVKEEHEKCYRIYFDFSDFEEHNEKYFKADYFDDKGVACLTAKDKGWYHPKYSVYFGDIAWDKKKLNYELEKHIKQLFPHGGMSDA
jgi:hypothetical protein